MKPQVPQQTQGWAGFASTSKEPCSGHEEQQLHSGLARKGKGKRRVQLHLAFMDKPVQFCLRVFLLVDIFVQSNSDHGSTGIVEPQNHGIVKVVKDFSVHQAPTQHHHHVHHESTSSSDTSTPPTSRGGDSTASLGILFQCLTTLSVKKLFQISTLNLPRYNVRPFLCYMEKRLTPTLLQSPPR